MKKISDNINLEFLIAEKFRAIFHKRRGLYFSPSSRGTRGAIEVSQKKIKNFQFAPEFELGNGGVIVKGATEK